MGIKKTAIDTAEYEKVVRDIKTENDEILNGFSELTAADPAIINNSVIPKFVQADSDVINMLQKLKEQIGVVINTMETFQSKVVEADQNATDSVGTLV